MRTRDVLARFGGEEFVWLLPETGADDARRFAERCRAALADAAIAHAGSAIGPLLTVSIGVGTTIPGHGAEPAPFIEAVDRCLYRAKAQGRDRIVQEDVAAD